MEEGLDVGGREVEDGAEGAAVAVEDGEGFGGGEGAGVARGAEAGAGGGDEGGEGRGGGVGVEDGFVADDDEFDEGPVAGAGGGSGPGYNVRQLGGGVGGAVVEGDADDQFQPVRESEGADVAQGGTVDRVESDGGEALAGYGGHVGADGGGGQAGEGAGVGRVGYGPLGGGGTDGEVGSSRW